MPIINGTLWSQHTESYDLSPLFPNNEGGVIHTKLIDVNGDGFLDAVLILDNSAVSALYPAKILLNDGLGNFSDHTADYFTGSQGQTAVVRQIVVGDFNGDGRADLFLVDQGLDSPPFPGGQNSLWLSDGAHGFIDASDRLPQQLGFNFSAATADIDNDGDLDIFVNVTSGTSDLAHKAYFLVNDGTGHFTQSFDRYPNVHSDFYGQIAGGYLTCAFVDANNDGFADLVLAESSLRPPEVLLNDGSGHFLTYGPTLPAEPFGHTDTYESIDSYVADVNGDGLQDIIALGILPDASNHLQFLNNNGDGSWIKAKGFQLSTI